MVTQDTYDTSSESSSGYGQLLGILWNRRFWFLTTFISTFVLLIPLALKEKPTYLSSMQLLVEPNYEDNSSQSSLRNYTDTTIQIDYATQLNLMRSSELLQKAVTILKPKYPDISINELKDALSLNQVIENEKPTKIFRADYISNDPDKSQEVMRSVQHVYQEYNLNQQHQRLIDGLGFVKDQLQKARKELSQAESKLKSFRGENNLIVPEDEATEIEKELLATEKALTTVNSEKRELEVLYQQLQSNFKTRSVTELLDNSRLSQSSSYQFLLGQILQVEVAIAEQSSKFTEQSPIIQELQDKRQQLKQLLFDEKKKLLGKALGASENNTREQPLSSQDLARFDQLIATQNQLSILQVRRQNLEQRKQELKNTLSRFPGLISEYNSLIQQVEFRRSIIQQLLQVQQQLGVELNRGGFKWQMIEYPQQGEKLGPNLKKKFLINGVVALFLGGVVAFLRDSVDNAVHTADQLKEQKVLPLLGVIPKWQFSSGKINMVFPRGAALEPSPPRLDIFLWTSFRESLDYIYQNIQLLNSGMTPKSLVVTSSVAGEGKSTLLLGLAFSASRLHQRVLVIDANLRSPTLHKYFELSNERGLSTLLANRSEITEPHTVCLSNIEIDLLTAGPIPQDPVRLLASRDLREMVQSFEQNYDLVLLDTPAVLGGVDAIQIASCAKGVVMVAGLDQLMQSELAESTALLSRLMPVGIVANGAKAITSNNSSLPEQNFASFAGLLNSNNAS